MRFKFFTPIQIKLDGRTMSITRDSGAIEYIAFPGIICAKNDSDVQVAMNGHAAKNTNTWFCCSIFENDSTE